MHVIADKNILQAVRKAGIKLRENTLSTRRLAFDYKTSKILAYDLNKKISIGHRTR